VHTFPPTGASVIVFAVVIPRKKDPSTSLLLAKAVEATSQDECDLVRCCSTRSAARGGCCGRDDESDDVVG